MELKPTNPAFDIEIARSIWRNFEPSVLIMPDSGAAAQELLDILAVGAGLKPMALLITGVGNTPWIEGLQSVASRLGLLAAGGRRWRVSEEFQGLPSWYIESVGSSAGSAATRSICRDPKTAVAVRKACEADRISATEEAELLGYPVCCVEAHYLRSRRYHQAAVEMIERLGAGDEAKMRRLASSGVSLQPATTGERDGLAAAFDFKLSPFTSVNMCAHCAGDAAGPAQSLSAEYRKLALAVDGELVNLLAAL